MICSSSNKRRQSICFNQYYKSSICDDILKIISKELAVEANFYDKIEDYLKYKKKQYEMFEKEYENKFVDYRNEDVYEKEKFIKEKLSNLRLHKLLQRIELIHPLGDFDAVNLYPSAMWDEK